MPDGIGLGRAWSKVRASSALNLWQRGADGRGYRFGTFERSDLDRTVSDRMEIV
jgi:hypothetical protein